MDPWYVGMWTLLYLALYLAALSFRLLLVQHAGAKCAVCSAGYVCMYVCVCLHVQTNIDFATVMNISRAYFTRQRERERAKEQKETSIKLQMTSHKYILSNVCQKRSHKT